MNKLIVFSAGIFCFTGTILPADEVVIDSKQSNELEVNSFWDPSRPDSHAPIGVMSDHTHHGGEFMLSYRYMFMAMDGQKAGTDSVSSQGVFERGFAVAPTSMQTQMHMFGGMYAPADWLTLMLMGSYGEKSMDHVTAPGSMARIMRGATFSNEVSGWGDLKCSALFRIYNDHHQRVHLGLGVSVPIGEQNELAYPMQFTTGTWDLLPSATWLWQAGILSGGTQLSGRIHLGDNDRGYSFGDRVNGTAWLACMLSDWVSLSVRLSADYISEIEGVDRRISRIMAPPMDASNSGGTYLDAGFGVNFQVAEGALSRNRLGVEVVVPIYQDVNGLQLARDWMLVVGWQYAF